MVASVANDLLDALSANSGTIDYVMIFGEGGVYKNKVLTGWEAASGGKIEMTDTDIDFEITSGTVTYTGVKIVSSNVSITDVTKGVATYMFPAPIATVAGDVIRISVLELGFV